jgi:hypothetical protein
LPFSSQQAPPVGESDKSDAKFHGEDGANGKLATQADSRNFPGLLFLPVTRRHS